MPFEDEVAIICNDEGKMNGMLPNRAVYAEPETVEMSYQEMTKRFREAENNRGEHLTGYVVFTEDSFDKPYSEESRTYVISSNNKAFQSGMGGYSIYALYLKCINVFFCFFNFSVDGSSLRQQLSFYLFALENTTNFALHSCFSAATIGCNIDFFEINRQIRIISSLIY